MVFEAPARPSAHANLYGDSCRAFTAEDWWAMPEDGNRYELLHGVLMLMPAPARKDQEITLEIAAALLRYSKERGGWAGVAPLGVTLGPDAVYVSPRRLLILVERGVEGAPDVVSRSRRPRRSDTTG